MDLSLAEGEIGAMTEETKQVMWLRNLAEELGLPQKEPSVIYNDNASGLHLVTKYDGKQKKMRYCLQKINFCLEKVKDRVTEYSYTRSEDLAVDGGTKLLTGVEFSRKADALLGNFKNRTLTPL